MVYSKRRFVLCLTLCYFVLVIFSPFSIAITSLGEEGELFLVLFVRLFDLRLFGFVCFLFLLVSGKGCGLLSWHSLDFSLTLFYYIKMGCKGSKLYRLVMKQHSDEYRTNKTNRNTIRNTRLCISPLKRA